METADEIETLTELLGELNFPAEKWDITTCAEIHGVDVEARRMLYALPTRSYRDVTDVVTALH